MERKSNFELLRILSIMIVVFSHFFVHGCYPKTNELTLMNVLFTSCRLGEIGVTCFVLISGYFLIDKEFSFKKLFKLVFQIWFYGASILLLCYIFGVGTINSKIVWKSLTPFYSTNWFAQAYLILYLGFPVVNSVIKNLSKKYLTYALLVFGVIWYIIPAFDFYKHGNMRITVFYVYMIGAYLKLYYPVALEKRLICFSLTQISFIGIYLGTYCAAKYLTENTQVIGRQDMFLAFNSIFVFFAGIGIFCLFKNLDIGHISFVNYISQTAFGIYLIHDNALIKKWLWIDVLRINDLNGISVLGYAIICTLVICIICSVIDLIRLKFVEVPILNLYSKFQY